MLKIFQQDFRVTLAPNPLADLRIFLRPARAAGHLHERALDLAHPLWTRDLAKAVTFSGTTSQADRLASPLCREYWNRTHLG